MKVTKRGGLTVFTDARLEPGQISYTTEPDHAATEPAGVRLHHADGSVSECSLVRDPDNDAEGNAHWIAVPAAGTIIDDGDCLVIDVLPGHTRVSLAAGVADG